MNKSDIINLVCDKNNLSLADTEYSIKKIIDYMGSNLYQGDRIEIINNTTSNLGLMVEVTSIYGGGVDGILAVLANSETQTHRNESNSVFFHVLHRSLATSIHTLQTTQLPVNGSDLTIKLHHQRGRMGSSNTSSYGRKIGVYSFALKPEEHQPSGTCNFSRIDTAKLEGKYNPQNDTRADTFTIYAVNYNVLRIMSGMGGLAYSN